MVRRALLAVAIMTAAAGCTAVDTGSPSLSDPESSLSPPTTGRPPSSTSSSSTTSPAPVFEAADPLPFDPEGVAERLTVRVEAVLSHDDSSVTTGLELIEDELLESVGLYGRSSRRIVDSSTGDVVLDSTLQPELYAQGITQTEGQGWQMSWQEGLVLVFDLDTLEERRRFNYSGEGWGICEAEGSFFTTAASGELVVRSVETFETLETIEVTLADEPLTNLTELECALGEVWAVVWPTATVVAIDSETGEVTKIVDANRLVPAGVGVEDVLGAIAYRPSSDTWFLTGRRWDVMYEVSFIPA